MRSGLFVASGAEALTGLALLVLPELVVRLLFGSAAPALAAVAARFAGIALIGLGVACWPWDGGGAGRRGMLAYGVLATLYLGYLGVSGGPAGPLLWPAVALHLVLSAAIARRPVADPKAAA